MASLAKSKLDEFPFRGHELHSCGLCFGEIFREESDPFGAKFKLYRDESGMIWRTVRPEADLGPATSPLVCCTCEDRIRGESHPAKTPEPLVVYDPRTGEQIAPTPPQGKVRWT